jgi:hypothetical protein
MPARTPNTWKDLVAPERERAALQHVTTLLDYPDGPSGPFGGLPESAAWALWIAGPESARALVERAAALIEPALRFLPATLPDSAALEAVDVGALARVAECTGAVVPAAPLSGWLTTLERRFADLPEIRVSTILFAIEAGSLDLATKLAKQRVANDSEASLTKEKRAFLLELATSVGKKQRSPELASSWEKVLAAYPTVGNALRFRPDEVFLVARLLSGFIDGEDTSHVAGDLHDDARRRADGA